MEGERRAFRNISHSLGLKGSKSGTWFHLVPKAEKAQDDVLM